jgi:excisionase family DNA binding protein
MSRSVAPPPDLASVLHALADRVDTLDPAQVVGELEALKFQLWAAATTSTAGPAASGFSSGLNVTAVMERTGMSKDWLYRAARAGRLPFARHLGRRVVFDEAGLNRWLERRSRQPRG